jgi:hypothetical protein
MNELLMKLNGDVDLEKLTKEQLLEIVCFNFLEQEYWVRLGFNLTQEDGYKHIAPVWAENYKLDNIIGL